MNERIKQLAEQAQYYAEYTTPQGLEWFDKFKEKFAELIVRECADIGERYADGNYEVYNQILKYFGMEEPEE